jgi:O-antigen ligase
VTTLNRRGGLPLALVAGAAGLTMGALAVGYGLRPKTSIELAIAALIIVLVCVAAGNPRRFLLAVVVFDIPLEWGKNLFWRADLDKLGAIAGVGISLTTFAIVGLYALWFLDRRGSSSHRPAVLRPALPLIAFVGVSTLSLLVARDRTVGLFEVAELAQMLLLFIYLVSNVRERGDVSFVITATLAALLLESSLIMFTYLTGQQFHFLGLGVRVDPSTYSGRVGGTVGSPNIAASYLCLMLSVALGVLASRTSRAQRQLALAAVPIGIAALIVTGSRGGWASFAVSVVILVAWALRQRLLDARAVFVAIVAAVALVYPFWGTITNRTLGNDNGAAASRVTMAKLAYNIISANPVLGVGVNNVPLVSAEYEGPQFDRQFIYSIHNKYLLVWAETGIGGILALAWFLAATLLRGWRAAEIRDPFLSPIAVGLAAGFAGQLIHMAVEVFANRAQDEVLWFGAAMLAAIELIILRDHAPMLVGTPVPSRLPETRATPAPA